MAVVYHISVICQNNPKNIFPKRSKKSRSILSDGSRFLGSFSEGSPYLKADFHDCRDGNKSAADIA